MCLHRDISLPFIQMSSICIFESLDCVCAACRSVLPYTLYSGVLVLLSEMDEYDDAEDDQFLGPHYLEDFDFFPYNTTEFAMLDEAA